MSFEHRFAPGMAETLATHARLMAAEPQGNMAERRAAGRKVAAYWSEGAPEVPFRDTEYRPGLGMRVYEGRKDRVLLFIHGGGWCLGSIEENDPACLALASESGWTVASITYRLAPEHPYPAGLEDCRAALRLLREQGYDAVAAGGSSAGGNLALALALAEPGLAALVSFYGAFGNSFETPSYDEFADAGLVLSRDGAREAYSLYDPEGRRATDPLLAPLIASDAALAALPPTFLVAAELDILRDDSTALAARMSQAELLTVPGVTHGYVNRARSLPAAAQTLTAAADFLKRHVP